MGPALDPWLRTLQGLGILVIIGAGAALWNVWRTWRRGRLWRDRIAGLLLAAACLDLVWLTFAFRLITPDLNY